MKKIEESFNKILLIEMSYSILYAIFGLIIFLKSEIANTMAGIIIGIFFLIAGIVQIYTFIDKNKIKLFKTNLIIGIINIILGLFIMVNPLKMLNILNISLGIAILIDGISKFLLFYNLKKVGEESKKIILVSTILLIFLSIMIIVNPFRTLVITKTIGIFIILNSIVDLNDLVLLKKRSKKFLKNFK